MVLSCIVGLQHLKVKIDGKCNVLQILEGLKKHSMNSLLSLSIKIEAPVDPYLVEGPSLHLNSFSKLSHIQGDGNLIQSLFAELNLASDGVRKPHIFPPVLKGFKSLLTVSKKVGNVLMAVDSEDLMGHILLDAHLPSTFRTMITVIPKNLDESALDVDGKVASLLRIKGACARFGIQLKLAEPEEDELF